MTFQQNESLLWVGGSFCNPRHVPCVFIKVSSNPKKIVVEVESPMGFKMHRTVHIENVMKNKVKKGEYKNGITRASGCC